MNEPRSDQEWADFYADQRSIYDDVVERLENLLEALLDEDGIEYGWVSSFSRTPEVFLHDLNRTRRASRVFGNPLESPLRVAGVIVMVETPKPMPEIVALVAREFAVDVAGSLSIEEAAARNQLVGAGDSDELMYEYPYCLVSLDDRRLELAEWSRFAGLKVRIEVKTALQDAWETIDLDLPFFAAGSYPTEVRELLARSAIGMAASDADLAEAKRAIMRLLAEYEDAVAEGELQLPVNGVSLMAYMRTSELVRSLIALGEDVGLDPDPDYEPSWGAIDEGIVWLLRRADVHTVAELEDFLRQATPRARTTLAELERVATDRGFTPWAQPESIVEWLWLVLRRADAETNSLLGYADAIQYALNTLIGNPTKPDSNAA